MQNMIKGSVIKPANLVRLCKWISDYASGEMIETPSYNKRYLSFDRISQQERDHLCQLANTYLLNYMEGWYVSNAMGEIVLHRHKGECDEHKR